MPHNQQQQNMWVPFIQPCNVHEHNLQKMFVLILIANSRNKARNLPSQVVIAASFVLLCKLSTNITNLSGFSRYERDVFYFR
jgi:hypothetical protein